MDALLSVLCILGAYFVGGIPTAYILARATRGIDIRAVGTRNVGAANVLREVGRWQGLAVLLADIGKGAAAAGAVVALDLPEWALFAASVAALLGHNFSPFLRFYGGKGVAVALGASLVIMPVPTAVTALPAVVAVMLLRQNVVVTFGLGALALIIAMVVSRPAALDMATVITLMALVLATAYRRARREWHETIGAFIRRVAKKPSGSVEIPLPAGEGLGEGEVLPNASYPSPQPSRTGGEGVKREDFDRTKPS